MLKLSGFLVFVITFFSFGCGGGDSSCFSCEGGRPFIRVSNICSLDLVQYWRDVGLTCYKESPGISASIMSYESPDSYEFLVYQDEISILSVEDLPTALIHFRNHPDQIPLGKIEKRDSDFVLREYNSQDIERLLQVLSF